MLYSFNVAKPVADQALPEDTLSTRQDALLWTLVWAVLGAGVFLRLFHYFDNRSLWVDEIYLMTSVLKMGFLELTTPALDYQQKAPIGFLWLVKASALLFGIGEKSLRLVPLLAGLASLIVFLPVARFFLKPLGVLVAMGVLAFAPPLVYHAVEAKQYGMEMFTTILSLYLYTVYHKRFDYRSLLMWGFWGALILWFSYASIFVLVGIAGGVSLYFLIKKQWTPLLRSMIPFSLWAVSFLLNYFLFTHKHAEQEWLVAWFRVREGFFPIPFYSLAGIKWIFQSLYRTLEYPLGVMWNAEPFNTIENGPIRVMLKMPLFMFGFWALGLLYFMRRNLKVFFILLFPLLLTLAATLLEFYPYYERLLVFLAPLPILLIAKGCERFTSFFAKGAKWRYIFPLIVLFWPMWSSAKQLVNPKLFGDYKYSNYREALLYVHEHYQEGDIVYVYWNIEHAYHYYKKAYGLTYEMVELTDRKHTVSNKEEYMASYAPQFAAAQGKQRVWFIYERFLMLNIGDYDNDPAWYHAEDVKGGQAPLQKFRSMGRELESHLYPNAGVSLFDLQQPPAPASGAAAPAL
ncbi:glycosyltransferase family 39 protein [Cesiribacter andamanensis]|uniref:Putative membrane protein n=1 Tax=Cesiribacter andamanensis AMV16 TaxID=1279009 RepID=M7N816_9BACT|nr:glycosyltransferase family 39 protein [Cesiribacter andamanensis]EMR04738.1 putative membrane protein [Cesiribacter andamanensis AMV16]